MQNENSSDWITICGEASASTSSLVATRVQERIAKGDYSEDDAHYVSEVSLRLTKGELDVSDTTLEKLRALCQLWDLELEPAQISSHRKFIGPIIVIVKRLLFPILQVLLKETISRQRAFNAAAISILFDLANETGRDSKIHPTKKNS